MEPKTSRSGLAVTALLAVAFIVPLWLVKYLPLVDLPQHVAQLSIWQHLDQPGWTGYELNWRTPYLVVYVLARPLLAWMSPLAALKAVLCVGVLALPAALYALVRNLDEPLQGCWALLGFPLAFSYSFHWGFLNFFFAQSLGVLLLAVYLPYLRHPSGLRGVALAALSIALFYTHALAYAACIGLAGLLAITRPGLGARVIAQRAWPLLVAVPIAAAWYLGAAQQSPEYRPTVWGIGWARIAWASAFLLGHPLDGAARALGALFLALPLAALRPRARPSAWLPVVAVALVFLLAPHMIFGTAYVYGRFAVLLVPTLLLALTPATRLRPRLVHGVIVGACLTWACVLATRWLAFDEEARDFDAVVADIGPSRAVRGLVLARGSEHVASAPVYDNFPIYVLADKGGIAGHSFAGNFLSFARYEHGAKSRVSDQQQMHPEQYDYAREPFYDYYLVRAPVEVGAQAFGGDPAVTLVANRGWWWLYRRAP